MSTILCPTRGGESSFPNQDRAIALAKERNTGLLFLYVADIHFLNLTASPVLVDMATELEEMGQFMLAMAEERAEKSGVQATSVVKRGVFRQALKEVVADYPITTVVLGAPTQETAFTTSSYQQELIEELTTELNVEFIVVDKGEIVAEYKPS